MAPSHGSKSHPLPPCPHTSAVAVGGGGGGYCARPVGRTMQDESYITGHPPSRGALCRAAYCAAAAAATTAAGGRAARRGVLWGRASPSSEHLPAAAAAPSWSDTEVTWDAVPLIGEGAPDGCHRLSDWNSDPRWTAPVTGHQQGLRGVALMKHARRTVLRGKVELRGVSPNCRINHFRCRSLYDK